MARDAAGTSPDGRGPTRRPANVVLVAVAGGALALGGALAISGDGRPEPPSRVPTEAEARAVLAERVAALRADPTRRAYCAGYAFCDRHWQSAGDAAVPDAPPHVLGSRVTGGESRVLTVCGRDGLGRPYRSDFPVHRIEGVPRATIIVFWANVAYEDRTGKGDEPVVVTVDPTYTPPPVENPPECG